MTQLDFKKLIDAERNKDWKRYFSDDEWLKVVNGLYAEYRCYSNEDLGFSMYYHALGVLLSGDGVEILRKRFLR